MNLPHPSPHGRLQLFALKPASDYGKRVSDHLGISLSNYEEFYHPDAECYIRSLENVRRNRVFVLADLYTDQHQTVDQKLIKLFWFIGSLRDASAEEISVIARYYPYARSDRKVKSREPVCTKYMAETLEALGCNRVLTMDVHNLGAFQNANRKMHVDNLECKNLLAECVAQELHGVSPEMITVMTLDSGGVGRASRFRRKLNSLLGGETHFAFFDKSRKGQEVSGSYIVGTIAPYTIVVDDMVSTGKSFATVLPHIIRMGGEKVILVATHGLFVGNANEYLSSEHLHKILVSDTVNPFRLNPTIRRKLQPVDTTRLFAEAIKRTFTGESLSSLFD